MSSSKGERVALFLVVCFAGCDSPTINHTNLNVSPIRTGHKSKRLIVCVYGLPREAM